MISGIVSSCISYAWDTVAERLVFRLETGTAEVCAAATVDADLLVLATWLSEAAFSFPFRITGGGSLVFRGLLLLLELVA